MRDSHLRSVAKGISYRLVGTISTALISFAMTGSVRTALLLGTVEISFKVVLFWGHERVWARIPFGREEDATPSARRWLASFVTRSRVPAPDSTPTRVDARDLRAT
jgi:uncharacterized membrane protein